MGTSWSGWHFFGDLPRADYNLPPPRSFTMEPYIKMPARAQGVQHDGHDIPALELNWAGCDVYGRDLLNLDEADSELYSDGAERENFLDINIITNNSSKRHCKSRRVSWGCVEEADLPLSPRNVPGNVLSSASTRKSPEYPPTLLELQVQALAKIGLVRLYDDDSKELEREGARAEKNRAILNQLDHDRQSLSPLRSHRQEQVQALERQGRTGHEKVALSSMKGVQKSSDVASTSVPSASSLLAGDGHLLELQKVALSNMTRTNQMEGGARRGPPPSAEGTDLLELQKLALASMRKLSEQLLCKSTPSASGPMCPSSAIGGDLLDLQKTGPKLAPPKEQSSGGDFSELQKVALRNISKSLSQQGEGRGDLLAQQQIVLKSIPNQGTPSPPLIVVTQPTGEDFLELQKIALRIVQNQTAPSLSPQQAGGGKEFLEELTSVQSQKIPTQIQQQGGDLLEVEKRGLSAVVSFSEWETGGKVIISPEEIELNQQTNTQGGTSPTSSPAPFDKMPTREALEMLSHEISAKDQALQFASRTIEEKDQLLREYEGSLANALNLLQSMNVRCTNAKVETAKALIEAEEIYGSLIATCSAIENFDSSIPTCAEDVPSLIGASGTTVANNNQIAVGMENGLGGNHVEVDERRNLVEELVRELHKIEAARKEAKEGCELQIERNEQLISELQRLDVAPPITEVPTSDNRDVDQKPQEFARLHGNLAVNVGHFEPTSGNESLRDQALQRLDIAPTISEVPMSDRGHVNQKPQEIARPHEDLVVNVGLFQPTSGSEIPWDQGEGKQSDRGDKIPNSQTKECLCNDAYKSPSDEAEEKRCVPLYEDPRDLAKENFCDHAYTDSNEPVYESTHCQVPQDLRQNAKKMLDDNAEESHPSNDKANQMPCDLAREGHPSDASADEKPCDHVFETHPSDEKANERPRVHLYERPSDQAKKTFCDHVYGNPYELVDGNSRDRIYVKPHKLVNGNSCDRLYEKRADPSSEKKCNNAYKNTHEHCQDVQRDHASESRLGQANENSNTHATEQNNKEPCDPFNEQRKKQPFAHASPSSSKQSCENPSDNASVALSDRGYKDDKDCGPVHDLEDIGSGSLNAPTCMGQLSKSLTLPEGNVSAALRSMESARQYNSHKYVATTSSPTSLWEHLHHFVKKQQHQACDDAERIQFSMQLSKLQGDLDLKTRELQSHLEHKQSETTELHEQINQLHTVLLQGQETMAKILLQKASDAPHGPTIADLEHRDRVIHKMNFHIHQMEATLQQEREEMVESLAQKAEQLEAALCQEREEMRESFMKKTNQLEAALCEEREEIRESFTKKTNQLEAALCEEREEMRKVLVQKTTEMSRAAATAAVDPDLSVTEINELHQQLHQMQRELEEKNNNLIPSLKGEVDNLQTNLNAREEDLKDLRESIARKQVSWEAEKHQILKCIDELETKLLVKEEEVIKLSHELEISRTPVYSKPMPDNVKFNKGDSNEGSNFFHKQAGQEEGREVLDLRCEVLSLRDCLGIKTQTIKTMEKELARSYNIVTELRSKVRAVQDCERNSQRQGQNKELIERLMSTEGKLQKSLGERAILTKKIQDLSARCQYLEEFEHLHREGSHDMKTQAIEELEKELERNVHIMQSLQARCDEYEARVEQAEARNMLESAEASSERETYDSWEHDHSQLAQLNDEKQALAAECEQLRSQIKRKDQVIIQLQGDMQNLKTQQNLSLPSFKYQQNALAAFHNDGRPTNSKATNTLTLNYSGLENGKGESQDVSTLTELLKEQWKLQKVMEDRLNTMMAYVSDRVDEFEQMSPSDATSNASFPPLNAELNHFHVEARLMKLQLEQQLQVLRGQVFTSLPASGMTSPGQQCPQNCVSTQNNHLWSEKNALEDSAQTLQEKTSRLLNRLTFMRTEYGPSSRQC